MMVSNNLRQSDALWITILQFYEARLILKQCYTSDCMLNRRHGMLDALQSTGHVESEYGMDRPYVGLNISRTHIRENMDIKLGAISYGDNLHRFYCLFWLYNMDRLWISLVLKPSVYEHCSPQRSPLRW